MSRFRMLPICLFLICVLPLGACCGSRTRDAAQLPAKNRATEDCSGIYLFAPSRYAISLVAKEQILIDPARHSVSVYCTPGQARRALKTAKDSGKVPSSMELQVYLLEGEWRDMVRKDGDKHFLNKAAFLLDTVD